MQNVEIKNKNKKNEFTLPDDYDFRLLTSVAFGCYHENETQSFKIHLEGYAARYAKNRIWGKKQKNAAVIIL